MRSYVSYQFDLDGETSHILQYALAHKVRLDGLWWHMPCLPSLRSLAAAQVSCRSAHHGLLQYKTDARRLFPRTDPARQARQDSTKKGANGTKNKLHECIGTFFFGFDNLSCIITCAFCLCVHVCVILSIQQQYGNKKPFVCVCVVFWTFKSNDSEEEYCPDPHHPFDRP